MSNFFEELEKIANSMMAPEDLVDPMVEDPQPKIPAEEVEAIQAQNAMGPEGAEAQQPASPEDVAELEAAVESAEQELAQAKEVLAGTEENLESFMKTAGESLSEGLVGMGSLAKLIELSTSDNVDDHLKKIASDRLTQALTDEDGYTEALTKTASELFEDDASIEALQSREGMEYVMEQLAEFAEDEELEKSAFETGGILNSVRQTAGDYAHATKNFFKLKDEVKQAKDHVDEMSNIFDQRSQALQQAKALGDESAVAQMSSDMRASALDYSKAQDGLLDAQDMQSKGMQVVGAGGAGLATAGLVAGKKIHDASQKEPEEELSLKTASDRMSKEETDNSKGGLSEMSQNKIVEDFLKIAGAGGLVDIANNKNYSEEDRKTAADTFNKIAGLSRTEMESEFVKVAQEIYDEDQLHEIVAGKHNEFLFDKVAYFIEAHEMAADELVKIAGAESVAAKGVGGALTDAKKNIEEKVEADKVKTETVANGEIGAKKADDKRGYNVINNPGAYQVEKTAADKAMLEEAELRKEAAYKEYIEADRFIKANS